MEDQEVAWDRVPVEMFIPVGLVHFLPICLQIKLTLDMRSFWSIRSSLWITPGRQNTTRSLVVSCEFSAAYLPSLCPIALCCARAEFYFIRLLSHRIQGKVESSRRNYGKIIEELFTYMTG